MPLENLFVCILIFGWFDDLELFLWVTKQSLCNCVIFLKIYSPWKIFTGILYHLINQNEWEFMLLFFNGFLIFINVIFLQQCHLRLKCIKLGTRWYEWCLYRIIWLILIIYGGRHLSFRSFIIIESFGHI